MAPKIKKRGSIVADAKEMLASPQVSFGVVFRSSTILCWSKQLHT